MTIKFAKDEKIRKVAEAYAQDAVDFLQRHYTITLDWSDASIAALESVLEGFAIDALVSRPTLEQVSGFSQMFGSYVGEVYRKNYGAEWGLVTTQGESFPGLKAKNGKLFWPWGAVHKRLTGTPNDNAFAYYRSLLTSPQ